MDEQQEQAFQQMRDWSTRPTTPKSAEWTPYARRQIRMQEDWDKRRAAQLEEQRALQAMDIQQKQFEMSLRDQQMQEDDFYYNRGLKEAEQKIKAQQLSEATAIINGLNQLDPRDPEYQQKRAKIFGNNPLGSADPNVQKVATEYEAANTVYVNSAQKQAAEREEIQEKFSEARQLGVSEKQLSTVEDIDDAGNRFINTEKLQRLIDTTKGALTLKEEERKEGGEEYKPMSVEQAQDELDIAQAEFDALKESEIDDTDPSYVRAESRFRRAEAQLKVSQGRTKDGKKPKELGPIDKSALDWANANPDDPRSSRIKQRLGVE